MIRTLYKSDIAQLLAIELAAQVVPWGEETFRTCFESGYVGWAIEKDKEMVGFVIASVRIEECHILNLCVAPKYQHAGFGRQLLDQALQHAKQQGVGVVYLEVRQSNTRAIALYRKTKFHLIGMRKDYYPTVSGHEDALVFARSLIEDHSK